jgi:hypothetical protein
MSFKVLVFLRLFGKFSENLREIGTCIDIFKEV